MENTTFKCEIQSANQIGHMNHLRPSFLSMAASCAPPFLQEVSSYSAIRTFEATDTPRSVLSQGERTLENFGFQPSNFKVSSGSLISGFLNKLPWLKTIKRHKELCMFRTPTETEPCAMNEPSYKSDTSLLIRDLTSKSSSRMDRTR